MYDKHHTTSTFALRGGRPVLDHVEKRVVVNQHCRQHAHVEQLVTAGPHVKLAREEALRYAEHIQARSAYVHGAHQAQAVHRVRLAGVGELEILSEHHVDPWNDSVESEQDEGGEAERAIVGGSELLSEAHHDAGGAKEDEDGDVDELFHRCTVESVVIRGNARPRYEEGDA